MAETALIREVPNIAQLADQLEDTGLDALEAFVHSVVVPMIRAEIPIGDPRLDPDPTVSLQDRLEVRTEGNTVFIEIDTEYAAVQHFANYEHPRGGKSHFVDHPLQAASSQLEKWIGEALQAQLEGRRIPQFRGPGGRYARSPYRIRR